jgi:uncharacterized protein (DUF924 family)
LSGTPVAPDAVLRFWFGADAAEAAQRRKQWFAKDEAFDALLRARFAAVYAEQRAGGGAGWAQDAPGALAAILLFDQFPRNMFRGTARMFESDALALALAQRLVAQGWDRQLLPQQRWFAYLPFEHSESREMQRESLRLFEALARDTGDDEPLVWARRHAEVIERFGRYPHRNALLGRASTADELAYLAQPGAGF